MSQTARELPFFPKWTPEVDNKAVVKKLFEDMEQKTDRSEFQRKWITPGAAQDFELKRVSEPENVKEKPTKVQKFVAPKVEPEENPDGKDNVSGGATAGGSVPPDDPDTYPDDPYPPENLVKEIEWLTRDQLKDKINKESGSITQTNLIVDEFIMTAPWRIKIGGGSKKTGHRTTKAKCKRSYKDACTVL